MWQESSTATATAEASVTLTLGSAKLYRIGIRELTTANDDETVVITVVSGGEQTSSYTYHKGSMLNTGTSYAAQASISDASIEMLDKAGNGSGESGSFDLYIADPSDAALHKLLWWSGALRDHLGGLRNIRGAGRWSGGTGAVTAIIIKAGTGNISGTFTVDELSVSDDSSEAWDYISTTSLTGATTDVALTGTYKEYKLVVVGAQPATDNDSLYLQVDAGGVQTSAYKYHQTNLGDNSSAYSANYNASAAQCIVSGLLGNAANESFSGIITVPSDPVDAVYACMTVDGAGINSSNQAIRNLGSLVWTGGTTALTSIRFLMSSGNLAAGTVYLYGLLDGTAVPSSARFTAASDEVLWYNGAVVDTTSDYIIAGWARVDSANASIVTQFDTDLINSIAIYDQPTDKVRVAIYKTNHSAEYLTSTNTVAKDTWMHIMVTHKVSTKEVRLYLNGVFEGSLFYSITHNTAAHYSSGSGGAAPPTANSDHYLCAWAAWEPVAQYNYTNLLAMAEYLYNSGDQIYHASLAGPAAHLDDITHAWDYDELSDGSGAVTRSDSVGSAHLTDSNTNKTTSSTTSPQVP